MKEPNEIIPYNPESQYRKSNIIVGSKYKSTLLENRLMAVCMAKIPKASEDGEGTITVTVAGAELRRLFGLKGKGGDFYDRLDKTAANMTGRTIGFSDPDSQKFEYTAVVTNAKYEDNVFTCEFNKNMRKYLKNIAKNFTVYSLSIMLSFKSNYSFRLYEILRSVTFPPKGSKEKINDYELVYSVAELKFELGVVNAELDAVKNELNNRRGVPNYEKAIEKSPEKVFEDWKEFRRCVIEVAVKEINENPATKMHVTYKTQKKGRGGKVYGIIFYVHCEEEEQQEEIVESELNEDEKADFYDKVMDIIDEKIKIREAKAISEAADYNLEKIVKAYELLKKQNNVDNVIGWLITAIKHNFETVQKKSSHDKIHDFDERTYDYKKLEEEVFGNK